MGPAKATSSRMDNLLVLALSITVAGHSIYVPISLLILGPLALIGLFFATPKRAAKRIAEQMKHIYSQPHEYKAVEARQFSGLDLKYYDDTAAALESEGFTRLGDMENLTLTQIYPHMRTFTRYMSGCDGTVFVAIFQIKPRGWKSILSGTASKNLRTINFQTEFSDGHYISSSNAGSAAKLSAPPQVQALRFEKETPVPEILMAHLRAVAGYAQNHPDAHLSVVDSQDEAMAFQNRYHAMQCAYRQGLKTPVTAQEMRDIAGTERREAGEKVMAEMEKQAAEKF